MADYTGKMMFQCGRFSCSGIVCDIKHYCFDAGIDCDIDVDKGWITHTVYITFTGPKEKIDAAYDDIQRWAAEWQR